VKTANLSNKLLKQLTVVLVIGQLVTLAVVYSNRVHVEEQAVSNGIGLFGKIVASSAYRALLDNDFTYLTLMTNDILNDEDVLSITVVNAQGQEFAFTPVKPRAGKPSVMVSPIMSREGETGKVRISFTYDNIRKKVRNHLLLLAGLQLMIMLSLMLVIRFFFRKDLGNKLTRIAELLERVRRGDLTHRIGSAGKENEITAIALGLDFLVEHLADTIRKMNHISHDLRHAVDQTRTVMDELVSDATAQQLSMDGSFRSLNEASHAQVQTRDRTDRIRTATQMNSDALTEIKETFQGTVRMIDSLDVDMTGLHQSINELTHSSKSVATLAGEAATSVNEVSLIMLALSGSVKEVSGAVHQSAALSEEATERIASKGIGAVGNAIDTANRIETFFDSLSDTITRLGSRSNEIAQILTAINEVTDQVSLLSLNALIIAAQAGENGKGFAVVAKEMKELALKAGRSAKEIEEIVVTIQREISDAVSETAETALAVRDGRNVAVVTGEVIDEILEVSTLSTTTAQEIADAASNQIRLIQRVQGDVEKLRELNEQVSEATDEAELSTASIMEAAHRVSHSLKDTRHRSEEQFRSLRTIAENSQDANLQLDEIALQSSRQQEINGDVIKSIHGNVVMAEAMVTAVRQVSVEIGDVFIELERLRQEMDFFQLREDAPVPVPHH